MRTIAARPSVSSHAPSNKVATPIRRSVRAYAAPVLLSAFLLFLVQPMLAKAILPWFGGVASVWIMAMLFFQAMLVVGYGYAYLSTRYLPAGAQPLCHIALLMLSLLLMPIAPWRTWTPGSPGDPSIQILQILFVSIGLPYFLLSTTGPLMQIWYAQAERVALPYRLFALSNLGSLAALLAYPVCIEPFITTRRQMMFWSSFYAAFVLLCSFAAIQFWRSRSRVSNSAVKGTSTASVAPRKREYLLWGALAAGGSALLVTVMNHLCQNVAPIPLLWVLPLSTYLLTFVLAFDHQRWYRRAYIRWMLPPALGLMMLGIFSPDSLPGGKLQIALYLGSLFIACLFCHGELARRKPHANHLTAFYLMIAVGGAAASIAIGLIAPHVSSWQVEFPETLVACALLALPALYPKHWVRRAATVALVAVLILLAGGLLRARRKGVIQQARSFYGALTVTEENLFVNRNDPMRVLYHGAIQHGTQFLAPALQKAPTAYYAPRSGVGELLHARRIPWNVGVIGLGVGTLAVYGRPDDSFTFFEIDPLIAEVARSKFSYLKDSRAHVKITIGDGRLSLQKEPPQQFNLLVIDAFSGDSIPIHLLTREAFELYFSKLKADGVIAIHISNKFVDLKPVLAGVSDTFSKQAVLIRSAANSTRGAYQSDWVLLSDGLNGLRNLPPGIIQGLPTPPPGFHVWTDDYSNIIQLLL